MNYGLEMSVLLFCSFSIKQSLVNALKFSIIFLISIDEKNLTVSVANIIPSTDFTHAIDKEEK